MKSLFTKFHQAINRPSESGSKWLKSTEIPERSSRTPMFDPWST
jgi:hypothetical protein